MATNLVKTALKSTSKMSLNERFQQLRQNQNQNKRQNNTNNKWIQNSNRNQLRQGSQKNRRLALQMANRPSVLAALRSQNPTTARPVKQRLGFKRFNNQTINNQMIQNQKQRNRNQMNLNYKPMNRNRNYNQNRRINTKNIGLNVGIVRTGLKNRLRRNQTIKSTQNVNRIGFKPKRRVGQQNRNQNQMKTGNKKKFQINRNFGARNTGRQQKPQKRRNFKPNKEQLDKDLDAYMAGTKSHLDSELDSYMTQTI